ncbi:MAG: class II aldolase/adducin family protein, partial [Peptococcaceae bacterium]|nr:class II aldolase/adducin family protein [Peptococcaceae bacterium]
QMVIDVFRDMTLKAAVLKKHGFVTLGQDIFKAYYLADVLEDNAKVACLIEQLKK